MYIYLLLGTIVAYVVLTRAHHYYLAKRWGCQPPSTVNFGFLGIKFLRSQADGKKHGHLIEKQADIFRKLNKHTFITNILGRKVVITSNGENMKAMVATQFNDYGIGFRKSALYPLIGHGIFASDGERWKASREMLRPQFAREQVGHIQTLEPHVKNLINIINEKDGQILDLQEYFHKLTMDAASEFLFGESTKTLSDDPLNDFTDAFNGVQDLITLRVMAGPLNFLIGGKEFNQNLAVMHKLVQHYVDIALNTSAEELDKHSKGGYILLYEIVKKTRDRKVLQDELLSVLLAGRNTTAGLLSFLFFELGRNPEILEKLKTEIYQQFGQGEDVDFDKITFESMKRCTYLKYCINETLRLHPPIARNLRVALKNTTLPKGGGKDGESPMFVGKNTNITFNLYQCHRQQEVFGKDADTFRPERWENLKPGWSFMPFGSGPRICLGQQFALTESSYVTIRLLQNFGNITSEVKEYPPKKISNATSRLFDGCNVSIH